MRPTAPHTVLAIILGLTCAAGAIVLLESADRHAGEGADFQRLVGGLGFGPALDLSRCANSFDPRLCPHCPGDTGPVPGGGRFCPEHAGSVLDYPPLEAAP
jgi:hypothetical protein